jgi:hypothetical protein
MKAVRSWLQLKHLLLLLQHVLRQLRLQLLLRKPAGWKQMHNGRQH